MREQAGQHYRNTYNPSEGGKLAQQTLGAVSGDLIHHHRKMKNVDQFLVQREERASSIFQQDRSTRLRVSHYGRVHMDGILAIWRSELTSVGKPCVSDTVFRSGERWCKGQPLSECNVSSQAVPNQMQTTQPRSTARKERQDHQI